MVLNDIYLPQGRAGRIVYFNPADVEVASTTRAVRSGPHS
jgi:hypothetical protein